MSKMSELSMRFDEIEKQIRELKEFICTSKTELEEISNEVKEAIPHITDDGYSFEENENDTISLIDVRKVFVEKARNGKNEEIKKLLAKYSASKLSEVSEKDYKKIIKEAENI